MPGFVLHLLHGMMIADRRETRFSEEEYAAFQMGLLMPDANKLCRRSPDRSHFYAAGDAGLILKTPDLSRFPYLRSTDNPFVLGYAAHLYLDRMFFGEYFLQHVHFLDEDGQQTLLSDRVRRVYLVRSQSYITVPELFSEAYLYGDYTMLNRYFTDRYRIQPVSPVICAHPIGEIRSEDCGAVCEALAGYLAASAGRTETKVFSADSLVQAMEQYAFGFLQWHRGVLDALQSQQRS